MTEVDQQATMECPMCAEIIKTKAKVCRFCNADLTGSAGKPQEKIYLKHPITVTSEKVYPDSKKDPIRLRDITHVSSHVSSKRQGYYTSLGCFATALAFGVADLGEYFGFVAPLVIGGAYFLYNSFLTSHSWVIFTTPAGKFTTHCDDYDHAGDIKAAVDKAIYETA
ncbi:hypothetical protein [Marinobacter sp. 1_MG-2023]|uniref:hypothetical protein n=1 Tax=Marinobacter sp. 1_MG-2023 TaxID=3062627 RepID=UPI0026E349E5|nr:hypothetical protein [Marinobacter sp. 1_MG-2023]MDO6824376.1 hypothetical protein [Marinobacter sp. 1_MG-2023]